jgi:hypothetical protein
VTDFLRSLLTPDGMDEGRAAVVGRHEWFTHAGLLRDFDLFKAGGLQLRNPQGVDPLFAQLCRPEIVCLSIFPKRNSIVLNKGGPMFKMAVHRDDLPDRIGIDCSFGATYAQAQMLHEQNTTRPRGEIFLEMVWNREVIISLDPISPGMLRVCPKGAPDSAPSEWPMLAATEAPDVAVFLPDIMGNVWL